MSEKVRTTAVHIFGHEYKIRSTEESKFVQEVALYVDELMNRISSKISTGTSAQIAVLAALNIAEELFRERRNGGQVLPGEAEDRMRALLGRLDEIVDARPEKKTVKG
jgi:cell division protein ZapA